MKWVKYFAVLLFAAMFFVACSDRSTQPESKSSVQDAEVVEGSDSSTETFIDSDGGGGGGGVRKQEVTANRQAPVSMDDAEKSKDAEPEKIGERKIIRNANLTLETAKPEEARQKIAAIADSKEGFVIDSTQRNTGIKSNRLNSISMKIRIPAEKFQESLDEIRKVADRVIVETVKGRDVTEEFVDIQARLKTKKALEERYLEIMKRATSVKDALEVERQLGEIRTEIESIEGRKRFLENQSSLSTIEVELKTPVEISASSTGFFYELKQAVSDGFEAALTFVLFFVKLIIAVLPFLILIVLPVFLLLRYIFRKYKRKITARKIVEEELEDSKIIDVE